MGKKRSRSWRCLTRAVRCCTPHPASAKSVAPFSRPRVCRRTGSLPFEPRFKRCSKKRRPSDPIALLRRTEMDDGVLGVGPGQYGYEITRIGHSLLMR
jgi:hypothetical protein